MSLLRSRIVWLGILLSLCVSSAQAEPLLVSLEAAGMLPVTKPQSDLFGPGAALSGSLAYPLAPAVLLGARLRGGALLDGDAPSEPGVKDPGIGTLGTAGLFLRLRPFAGAEGERRATGLFLDAGGGGAITGELVRASFEAGLGYGIAAGSMAVSPVLRYVQVLQPTEVLSSEDARLLMLGVELTFLDARPAKAPAPERRPAPLEPADRDHDRILDADDACIDVPEDYDGHQDTDGCPEPDNDGDGILDTGDRCPNDAEDLDQWQDEDGCPDPDNDEDTFLDADDQCPNEAEIINGNKDYDGCPDEGLIELKNDRIVLEERVLFDFERARVKRQARPILRAIAQLMAQHPEWIAVRIEGHADTRGDSAFNQELSERRANNVMRALVRLGIPEGIITAEGHGATRPRDKRETEDANARNRRVEFVVIARGQAPAGQSLQLTPNVSDEDIDASQVDDPVPPARTAPESSR